MTKYAVNACVFSSIEILFFFINYDFEPRMNFDEIKENASEKTVQKNFLKKKTTKMMTFMKRIWKHAKANLQYAQNFQKRFVNVHQKTAFDYRKKNLIWLSTKNLRTKKSSKKLNYKMIKIFSNACRLECSKSMKIHNTFHTSLLKSTIVDFLFNQTQSSSSSVMINEKEKYEIEKILNFRLLRNILHYKIQWKNYSFDDKWYSVDNFNNAQNLIANFHVKYRSKSELSTMTTSFNYRKASVKTIEKKQ